MAGVRREHAAGAAGRALRGDGGDASIFHCFFEIETLANFPQAYNAGPAVFRGLYEDNDPKKTAADDRQLQHRHLTVLGMSGRGLRPFDETNEAYKLGVNYIIYGMTH